MEYLIINFQHNIFTVRGFQIYRYVLIVLSILIISFSTILSEIIYYSADFNEGEIPDGMLVLDKDGLTPVHKFIKNAWLPYIDPTLTSYVVISTSKYDPKGQADDWLITPAFNVGSDAILEWEAMAVDQNKRDGYEILISEGSSDINDFTLLLSIPEEISDWQKRFINLSSRGYSNKNIRIAFRNNSFDKNVLYLDNIKIYTPINYDAGITVVESPKWFPIQDSRIPIKINIYNYGFQVISSLKLMVSVNEEIPSSYLVDELNLQFQSVVEELILYEVSSTGLKQIKIWVESINGQKDQNHTNDTVNVITNVYDKNKAVMRRPCLEVFTSSTCGICKGGNSNLFNVLKNYSNLYTKINFQMDTPAPGDKYFTQECKARFEFYKATQVPFMTIDGSWNKSSIQFTPLIFNDYLNVPSFINISASYSVDGEMVSVGGTITSTVDYKSTALKLYIIITEDETHNNAGTNGETVFYDVAKKMLPDIKGIIINSLTAGVPVPFNISYTFRNEGVDKEFYTVENYNNLSVAILIQNDVTKEIYQSLHLKHTTGVSEYLQSSELVIQPNPADNMINVEYNLNSPGNSFIEISDLQGNRITKLNLGFLNKGEHVTSIYTSNFKSGVYFLKIISSEQIIYGVFIIDK